MCILRTELLTATIAGRRDIPMEVFGRPRAISVGFCCGGYFLLVGVERRATPDSAEYIIANSKQLYRINRYLFTVYIFKHSTVTGVFISMFVKYVSPFSSIGIFCEIFCSGFVFFSTLYYLPQFFQVALGYDPLHAGTSAVFF